MKNKIWIVGLALTVGSLLLMLSSSKWAPAGKSLALISSAYSGGWSSSKGESAKTVLVEYADFQCPACRAYYPTVKQLSKDFSGKLKIIYRPFPLAQLHVNALSSALAAEAAGLQGKFWEMHDLLFENQDAWKDLANPRSLFESYAKTIGIDIAKFDADLDSPAALNRVKESYDSGIKLGLQSTPTFFLNGNKIANPKSYDEFKNLIQNAINS